MKYYEWFKILFVLLILNILFISCKDRSRRFTNSVGLEMVQILPGEFQMGNDGEVVYEGMVPDARHAPYRGIGAANPYLENGPVMSSNPLEWDELPEHKVSISNSFYMSSTPVTNVQYEQFRPEHKKMRGKRGFSNGDNEAVVYVSWEDAVAFTKWLSKKEGQPYRLPTEAEWEYTARAGTSTPYWTGDTLPKEFHRHQVMNRRHTIEPTKVNLEVGKTPPNQWGLHDMHGIVEEWAMDWYGPYSGEIQTDPRGPDIGFVKVARGGSHSTGLPFLRSANRSGALPDTRHFLIGFRVVRGELPDSETSYSEILQNRWSRDVKQEPHNWLPSEVSMDNAIFKEPITYTRIPEDANGPLYFTHNHEPALTALPNGDLLAIWFTTVKERGREMLIAGSRLRRGAIEWDEADVFFHVPDRNQTGQALWWDGGDKIYHFSGIGTGDQWRDLSMVLRTSVDNGVTWSHPKIIGSEYGPRHQVIDGVIRSSDGSIVLKCDASPGGNGGTIIYISRDDGETWVDPGKDKPEPSFINGGKGGRIAGIHAAMVELNDGRLMAFGRGNDIDGRMVKSVSEDKGKTWIYSASEFDPIGGAQRPAMIRLQGGAILMVSFSSSLKQTDPTRGEFIGSGMFAALSYDEGITWPVQKLITPGGPKRVLSAPCNQRWGEEYSTLDYDKAEKRGYLSAIQTPDGMIHVISSGTYYSFNLAWIVN